METHVHSQPDSQVTQPWNKGKLIGALKEGKGHPMKVLMPESVNTPEARERFERCLVESRELAEVDPLSSKSATGVIRALMNAGNPPCDRQAESSALGSPRRIELDEAMKDSLTVRDSDAASTACALQRSAARAHVVANSPHARHG